MDDGWSMAIRAPERRMEGAMAEKSVGRLVSTRDLTEAAGRFTGRVDAKVEEVPKRAPGDTAKKILDSVGKPKRYRVGKFPSGGRKIEGPSR